MIAGEYHLAVHHHNINHSVTYSLSLAIELEEKQGKDVA